MIAIWSGFWPLNCDIGTVILDHFGHLGHDLHTMLAFWANMGPVTLVDGGGDSFSLPFWLGEWWNGSARSRPSGPLRAADSGQRSHQNEKFES